MERVLQLHAAHPDLVAGFDLVAEEDCGGPLKEFVPQLLRLPQLGVPTFYHAGETCEAVRRGGGRGFRVGEGELEGGVDENRLRGLA